MPAFNKFNSLVEAICEKVHNFGTDSLKVMLTNVAPVAGNTQKSNITDIAAGNGYTAGGHIAAQVSSAQTAGTYKLVLTDVIITAAGGSIGPFRYAVLYNDSATNDELVAWWEYAGGSITLLDGESITIDFNATTGVFQLA